MKNTSKLLAAATILASTLVPGAARAAAPRPVSCTVSVNYLLNSALRSTYQKSFVVTPDAPFSDDFSNAVRFGFLDATSTYDDISKTTTVSLAFYRDVSAIEFIDLRTQVAVRDDRVPATSTGSSSYWSSFGVAGEHITDYTLTCQVLKD